MEKLPSDDNNQLCTSVMSEMEEPVGSKLLEVHRNSFLSFLTEFRERNKETTDVEIYRQGTPQTIITMDESPADDNNQSSESDDKSGKSKKEVQARSKPLKVYRNPFMNFLRKFREGNGEMSNIEIYKQGAINWKELNQNEKLKFNFKFIQQSSNVRTKVTRANIIRSIRRKRQIKPRISNRMPKLD